ncbi:uncharacterized protein LOC128546711, partial [Mercenaria mercenaria]|uniref:uncharacterized protein LOC128546711 n=1 Tax=Mercenaria mercenaria TaxID=6596 RepID=UPI00234F0021
TPVKEKQIDCFVCFTANSRSMKLNGRKSTNENFMSKLDVVLGDNNNLQDLINISETSFCRNCYKKIEQTYEFLLLALLKEATSCEDDFSKQLQEVRLQSASLTSRTASFGSVLYKYRDISRLEENADHFLDEIIEEMIQRVIALMKSRSILNMAVPANENMKQSIIPAIASAYSILMKHKYDNLSAYHRSTTIIAVRGGLEERVS